MSVEHPERNRRMYDEATRFAPGGQARADRNFARTLISEAERNQNMMSNPLSAAGNLILRLVYDLEAASLEYRDAPLGREDMSALDRERHPC